MWSPDGRTIYYWAGDQLLAATVRTTPTFSATGREPLFRERYYRLDRHAQYHVHPDGDRFVMVKGEMGEVQGITVVVNWFEELKERMGN